jgi:type IV pilus assembly protein PilX
MLNLQHACARGGRGAKQRGTVLLIALILLVALSLAGIALIRSVSTSNIIAGNLAFQQATVHSADAGVEAALTWLQANSGAGVATLHSSVLSGAGTRYVARREDPATGVSWDAFWSSTLSSSGAVNTLATDAAGNTVSFVIHRLCDNTGAPTYPGCSAPPTDTGQASSSKGGGILLVSGDKQVYYRITVRVAGPRNTLSYVQATIAI